ncbi:MAG TPA: glycosyltransferase family 1 protein [Bryobacteraceae bacterium]|nr:glycosyltransferase family 1 protein [Bryobacteraceae bacterium]
MPIALDATYSLGRNLSGIGVYSREIMHGLARAHPNQEFLFCYRPHRFLASYRESIPANAVRRLLAGAPPGDLFHALNQRVDARAPKTICTFHDLFVMTSEYSSPEFRARFIEQAKLAAERSDLIIAVSRFTAAQVQSLLAVPSERIRVIHHGVRIAEPVKTAREKLILFVGAVQKRKNLSGLARAFSGQLSGELSGWKLTIAGALNGYGGEEEVKAIDACTRRTDIEILGYVSAEQLESLYRRASIFAFPSLDEGFGMPVLEAMAHGVPVITSNRSSLPEVAGDAALLVDPLEVDSIAAALARLASDAALRADLARRGLERARQFSWESAVEKTWQVYNEIR